MLKKQNNKDAYIDKTIHLYTQDKLKYFFARARFLYAPFLDVEHVLPTEGRIVDLGSAEGILGNFLALCEPKRTIIGIEINQARLKQANKGVENTSYVLGDITKVTLPKSDCIILFHVLHHIESKNKQLALLQKCKKSLNKNGKIIIVEILVKPTLSYFFTWFTDHFLVAWFFEKTLFIPINFRKKDAWVSLLKDVGFTCKTKVPKNKLKIFSNIIIEAIPQS